MLKFRYWLARHLLSASLWVMPRGRYRTELRRRIYEFRNEAMLEVFLAD